MCLEFFPLKSGFFPTPHVPLISRYFGNETIFDVKTHHSLDTSTTPIKFIWSTAFNREIESWQSEYRPGLNWTEYLDERAKWAKVIVIGEHVMWPLQMFRKKGLFQRNMTSSDLFSI